MEDEPLIKTDSREKQIQRGAILNGASRSDRNHEVDHIDVMATHQPRKVGVIFVNV